VVIYKFTGACSFTMLAQITWHQCWLQRKTWDKFLASSCQPADSQKKKKIRSLC